MDWGTDNLFVKVVNISFSARGFVLFFITLFSGKHFLVLNTKDKSRYFHLLVAHTPSPFTFYYRSILQHSNSRLPKFERSSAILCQHVHNEPTVLYPQAKSQEASVFCKKGPEERRYKIRLIANLKKSHH